MKARNACIPCMLSQAYNTAVQCTDDRELQRRILDETMRRYTGVDLTLTPGEHSQVAFELCRELSGVHDPYHRLKTESNEAALELYPALKERLAHSADPLRDALLLAVAGNIIDLAIASRFDLVEDIVKQIDRGFDVEELEAFRAALGRARSVLYLADNCGEIVFDRLLVEVIGPERVALMVKAGPIVNDAMLEDAEQVGLTDLCRVVDTGSNYFGFPWGIVSEQARQEFAAADLVISKGHANFETVSELGPEGDKVWYLLKVKCDEVASELQAQCGDIVLVSHSSARKRAGEARG
ncbi:ARMT1-like domain-containing protein [bacterium]|nr:ARMT1-like domain-containing protein [bacterium]